MIGIFTLILEANESREVAASGEYFELRNALSPLVLIELLDRTGGVVSRLVSPEQSDYVKPGLFETVRITNGATAQTIRYFYGTGDAGSRRFSGNVSGTVDLSATTLAALESVDLNAATVNLMRRPLLPVLSWKDVTSLALGQVLTIFTAAENVNGAILNNFNLMVGSANTPAMSLLAKLIAPVSLVDGDVLGLFGTTGVFNTTLYSNFHLPKEITIKAGVGLFFYSDSPTSHFAAKSARYTLL